MGKLKERFVITRPSPEDEAMVAECLSRLDQTPLPRSGDEHGRFRPMSDGEWEGKMAAVPRLLEEMKAITDESETEEMWEQFERNIDQERRDAGMRTLFEGRQ